MNSERRIATGVLATPMLCCLVILVSGWANGRLPAPPQCPPGVNSGHSGRGPTAGTRLYPWTLHAPTPGEPGGHPLYMRFCGPARAVVRLHGQAFRIAGGWCENDQVYEGLGIGLIANPPAKSGTALTISIHAAARVGTFMTGETVGLVVASVQTPSIRAGAVTGTVTVDKSTQAGTFAGHLDDATRVTGSWTCG